MKTTLKFPMLLGASLATAGLLSACTPTPTPDPGVNLTFSLPDAKPSQNLMLAAVYYTLDSSGKSVAKVTGQGGFYNSGPAATAATGSVYLYNLNSVMADPNCLHTFGAVEGKDMQNVTITPSDVKTCNIYFVAYEDANGDKKPTESEVRYITHDMYSYASSAFSYSMTTADGNSTESGTRKAGWSLVRHLVLEPVATPGKYQVSMNSVPLEDQAIALRLHEKTDFFTSMSLGGQK